MNDSSNIRIKDDMGVFCKQYFEFNMVVVITLVTCKVKKPRHIDSTAAATIDEDYSNKKLSTSGMIKNEK